MITVQEFKNLISKEKPDTILNDLLLSDNDKHVDLNKKDYIKKRVAEKYNISSDDIRLIVVGSAKLGFSIVEKKYKDRYTKREITLPRYRSFGPGSDIDIAVISPKIFDLLWDELSSYANRQIYMPWNSDKLGDYLVHGWLRPDHFPQNNKLINCDTWWDTFRRFSSERELGRKKISGGLYYNFEQLKKYQSRALMECKQSEILNR